MRKTVHKLFWAWNFDKEEAWLGEMAAHGWTLVSVGLCTYHFEETAPDAYYIRMEMLKGGWSLGPQDKDYIRFVEDTGAEFLGNVKNWVYFRKKSELGPFDLFSDIDSRIGQLKQLLTLLLILFLITIPIGLVNLYMGITQYSRTIHWSNTIIGIIDIALAVLCGLGWLRLYKKKKRLAAERALHE